MSYFRKNADKHEVKAFINYLLLFPQKVARKYYTERNRNYIVTLIHFIYDFENRGIVVTVNDSEHHTRKKT